jgi:hypothetical protein
MKPVKATEVKRTIIEILTDVRVQNQLSDVISKFIGQRVFMHTNLENDRHGKACIRVESSLVDTKTLGIGAFLFKKFTIGSFDYVYIDDSPLLDKRDPWFQLHASYKHHSGGSNGHNLEVSDGRINLVFDLKKETWFVVLGR